MTRQFRSEMVDKLKSCGRVLFDVLWSLPLFIARGRRCRVYRDGGSAWRVQRRAAILHTDTGGYTLFVLAQCRLLARPARRCVRELTPDQERITSYTDVTPCAVQISRFIRVRRNIFVYVRYPNTRRILKAYQYLLLFIFISVVFTVYIKIYFVYSLLFNQFRVL